MSKLLAWSTRRKWVKLLALKIVRSRCKIYYRLAGHDRRGPLIWWHKGSVSRKWIPLLIFKEHIPRPLKELTIIYQAFQMVQITFIFSIGRYLCMYDMISLYLLSVLQIADRHLFTMEIKNHHNRQLILKNVSFLI